MVLVKREAGESPARTRRCNEGVFLSRATGKYAGKAKKNDDS